MKSNKSFNYNALFTQKSPELATTNTLSGGLAMPFGQIMNEIARRPEVVRQTDQIIAMSDNKELRNFYAGAEYGHSRGHSEGFGKGLSLGILGMLFIVLSKK